ncbi:MAG TPA: RNA chaperone Hfq [Terriglobales bacterium]
MKNGMDSTAVGRAPETESFGNRKLIRPSLTRENRDAPRANDNGDRERRATNGSAAKKTPPPDQTHAENFYYQKQMQTKTSMVIVLQDGEEIHGVIEWYDKHCIKVTRNNSANLLIYKPSIKYMYKEGEMNGRK